jgi:cytochrome oxidase Cu insertion factor (SCO1/SenC/PrrC family)
VNQFGQPMSLSQLRGKVVLLSFDDALCTTACPLTTQEMLQAKRLLDAAGEDVRLLGVDANPDATSTADVMAYSRGHHGMQREPDLVIGGQQQAQHDLSTGNHQSRCIIQYLYDTSIVWRTGCR